MSRTRPSVAIITPALANANNGNWHTARRWQQILEPAAQVSVALHWDGKPVDAMIALHARRSADSITQFRAAHAHAPLALVMTGTDLYRDIRTDTSALHALSHASHLVVLQEEGMHELAPVHQAKCRVITQSAPTWQPLRKNETSFDFVAVGHLRSEKDPLTLMRAARRLKSSEGLRVVQIGNALEEALGQDATITMRDCPHYEWHLGLTQNAARRWIARARALVISSTIEGGANVIIEALRTGVPVLASFISGNVGMLGRKYGGYFPVHDDAALAELMRKFASDADFRAQLTQECEGRAALFAPDTEQQRVLQLLADMLRT
ncbi:MAG: selenoneine biosynthesis selenosugar synthase SenB [Burkholderiaceae bacterium]